MGGVLANEMALREHVARVALLATLHERHAGEVGDEGALRT